MTNYAKGANRERQLMKEQEDEGYVVTRSAGSRSPHDLVVVGPARRDSPSVSQVQLIQVKTDAKGPFAHFGPVERTLLSETARRCGGIAILVWWPTPDKDRVLNPEGRAIWYYEHEWPNS